ncbi:MAG: KamA family radical SAM protein [Christensenellales bacterium]|jgi:lysine 2,3-aminomutase
MQNYDWRKELEGNITTACELASSGLIAENEKEKIAKIISKYPVNITSYYKKLIRKYDYTDPIYRMCVASVNELTPDGREDVSGEAENTVEEGLQHKYSNTLLVLSTNVCAMYCRHCFRKRMVGKSEDETLSFTQKAIDYAAAHPEIDNVLITGGDSFMNSNKVIESFLKGLCQIEHLKFIRFGTRLPVVLPGRIYQDKQLLDILAKYRKQKNIYVVTQFNHPRELTEEAQKAIEALNQIGIHMLNQTVLLAGVNDNANTLVRLFNGLVALGVSPYYLFQCRPIKGVKGYFNVPFSKGWPIVEETRAQLSGLAKRFRFAMSHIKGKMEILGITESGEMLLKQHQAKNEKHLNKIFTVRIDKNTSWLPDNIEYKPL